VTVPEARLEETEHGLVPAGDGWFVVNAREARWLVDELGAWTGFAGEQRFEQVGINLCVLQPGVPMAMYHWENEQEDFLVLSGEALAIVEGEERPLRQWDLVLCPVAARHVVLGAGDGPCVLLAIGSRSDREDWGGYPVDETALRHGASVEKETTKSSEAYARFTTPTAPTRYRDGWLPDL
jgi:uncharacterized cupin superfamily protein